MRSYSFKFVRKILGCLSMVVFISFLTWNYKSRGSLPTWNYKSRGSFHTWNYKSRGNSGQVQWKNNLKELVENLNNNSSRYEALSLLSDDSLAERLSDCSSYFSSGQIPVLSLDTDLMDHEQREGLGDFPLAFSHLVHHQIGILEAFLALYFRPYNTHVIHIDKKASSEVKAVVSLLASCYQRQFQCRTCVLIPSEPVSVSWADSVLEAEMVNWRSLLETPGWRFVSSVAGSELPVLSYLDFVRKLQTLPEPGAGFDSFAFPENNQYRLTDVQKESSSTNADGKLEYLIEDDDLNVAMRIQLYKGSRYVVMSRERVEFVTWHPIAAAYHTWVAGMKNLEETYYATLLRIHVDGDTGLIHQNNTITSRDTLQVRGGPPLVLWGGLCLRIVLWYPKEDQCHGQVVHSVCNFGLEDVAENLEKWDCILANKFNLEVDARAVVKQMDYIIGRSRDGVVSRSG